jgi:hypothetical protein
MSPLVKIVCGFISGLINHVPTEITPTGQDLRPLLR